MSIKLMARVWECNFTHAQQAIMLALADHADDDGSHVYPSLRRIAWKTGYSLRQVKRIIGELRRSGALISVAPPRRGRGAEYQIRLEAASGKAAYTTTTQGDKTSPQRRPVVASPSADMAYEHGTMHVSYDDKSDGKHHTFDAVMLNVYKGKGAVCQQVAGTMQPLEDTVK